MAYIYYNPNPNGRFTGDCVIRSLAKALNLDWDHAYLLVMLEGFELKDMPDVNYVWESVLLKHGFTKELLPINCPNCYTVSEFAERFSHGRYILATGSHVVTLIDGDWYDSWDSSREVISYIFRRDIE